MTAQQTAAPEPKTMQLAEILSDLVSLRVCDPAAALALVSARPHSSTPSAAATHEASTIAETKASWAQQPEQDESDPDLKRAKELVELHYGVKEAHKRGELSRGLHEARAMVERAVGG